MSGKERLSPATLLAQAGGTVDPSVRALVPPIHPSASYERAPDGSYPGGHSYTRDQNPTYDAVEALLARLEGGPRALLFASGMAAVATVLDALEPGARVVAPRSMYWTARLWMQSLAERARIALELVPTGDLDALRAAVRAGGARLVWIETPSNPLCTVTDVAAAAAIAHEAGAIVACDGTTATPILTRPLELGADLVVHSATKQLNGHSDVLAGAIVTAREDELWSRIRAERGFRGAVPGPFEAWLLLRGMRTLALRVRESARGARIVAEALSAHPGVARVLYPGLPAHPGHETARRQMQGGFGSLVSFRLRGGEPEARRVAGRVRLFRNATSLGGVESLVEHRAAIEGAGTDVPADLLRLSVGIEEPADLVEDLRHALAPGPVRGTD